MRERLLGERDVGIVGVGAGAEPGDPLMDGRRRVRHGPHDGDARCEMLLDRRRRGCGGDGEHRLLGRDRRSDLAEEPFDVLGLHGYDDEGRTRRRLDVVHRRGDAVSLGELDESFRTAARRDDVLRPAPARREEARDQRLADPAGAQHRDTPLVDRHA